MLEIIFFIFVINLYKMTNFILLTTQKYIQALNKIRIVCIIIACRQLENERENLEESKKL